MSCYKPFDSFANPLHRELETHPLKLIFFLCVALKNINTEKPKRLLTRAFVAVILHNFIFFLFIYF